MRSEKVTFQNAQGHSLSGRLSFPPDQHPHAFAIFAHCFTCSKNLNAVRTISQALTNAGLGVLRFDFTGLGESEGDFSHSNFSSNVDDLVTAAQFLEKQYMAPALLIGHSLGGAAVIFAAAKIESVQAITTIGAPADPVHVRHLLKEGLEEIKKKGEATVQIGGRPFTIKKQFLDDLLEYDLASVVNKIRKPILILHSPQDLTVEVENARKIYRAAHHPKSFISLDGADHLLSEKQDAFYAGEMIGCWLKRYIAAPKPEDQVPETRHQVAAQLGEEGFTTSIRMGNHHLLADEPVSFGGNDFGPSPYQLLSASLAACTVMTLQLYARRKKWPLTDVVVHINHAKEYAQDCEDCESSKSKIDTFDKVVELHGDLSAAQRKRLLEIAERCPVNKTLHSPVQVKTYEKEA